MEKLDFLVKYNKKISATSSNDKNRKFIEQFYQIKRIYTQRHRQKIPISFKIARTHKVN